MQITKLVVIKTGEALSPRVPVVYEGIEYRSVHEGERRRFTVKPTAKLMDERLDIVQLLNAKAVMTPLTEQKSLNYTVRRRCAIKFNTHCSELWLRSCST